MSLTPAAPAARGSKASIQTLRNALAAAVPDLGVILSAWGLR